jgi:hypothetical protein
MTVIDALKQAGRECGFSEEEIQTRMAAAQMRVPLTKSARVPPGREREFIEDMKRIHRHMQNPVLNEAIERYVDASLAKKSKSN